MVRFPAFLLSLLLVCPLLAQVERPISDVRIGIASSTRAKSAVGAAGDGAFLAAWTSMERGGQAVRLDASARRLDPTSIGLPLAPRVVFFDDGVWIVVGDDGWVRVDRDGVLLDPVLRPHAHPLGHILGGAWTGSALVLASYADRKVTAYTLDAGMRVVGERGIASSANNSIDVRVASDGNSAVIVSAEATLQASLFDARGTFVKKKSIADDDAVIAAVGSDGDGYLVVRYHAASGLTPAFYGALQLDRELRVEAAPTSVGHRGATITHAPTLSWDGSAYTFFYASPNEVRAARLSADGTRIDDDAVASVDREAWYGISGDGATLLLSSNTSTKTGPAYLSVRALENSDETALEVGAMAQDMPAAASSATQSFVVWRERIAPGTPLRIHGTRVARDGTILDPQSIPIANGICEECAPAVGSNGQTFAVAWFSAKNQLVAAIYGANGVQQYFEIVEERTPRFGVLRGKPAVYASGSQYVIVWSYRGELNLSRQYSGGYFITWITEVDQAEVPLQGASDGTGGNMLAWGGSVLFLNHGVVGLGGVRTIAGDRASAVWWNGTTYSVLHGDETTYNVTRFDTRGVLVGTVAAFPRPRFAMWGETSDPQCDAKGCLLTFGAIEDGRFVLRGLRVDDDGTTVTQRMQGVAAVPRGHLLDGETMQIAPMQAAGGSLLAAYTRRALEPPYAGISRVFLRTLDGNARNRAVRH